MCNMEMNQRIRKITRDAMEQKGISTYRLAELTGMQQPNVTRLLTGRSGSIPESWQKILDALNLELVAVPKGTNLEALPIRKGKKKKSIPA